MLKHRENYEIIDPKSVGVPDTSMVLTARSGRAAFKHRVKKLGFSVAEEKLDGYYQQFLEIADKQKQVNDDNLLAIVGEEQQSDEAYLELENLKVSCGTSEQAVVNLSLKMDQEIHHAEARGNGPIDASFKAVKQIVKNGYKLDEFLVQAITGGSDDVGKVHVQLERRKKLYYGFGADTDIITASVKALLNAVNQLI